MNSSCSGAASEAGALQETLQMETKIPPDPYKYLIDIEGRPDLRKLDPAVQVYLRILGHTKSLSAIKGSFSPAKLADAELAGGWIVLKRSRWPGPGEPRRSVFFDPKNITELAVQTCPSMPYLFNVNEDTMSDQFDLPTTLEPIVTHVPIADWIGPVGHWPDDLYVHESYGMILSNAIVPLPSPCVPRHHPAWTEMVKNCCGYAHPINLLGDGFDINQDNDDRLIISVRNTKLRTDYFAFPNRNQGVNEAADKALYEYERDVLNLYSDLDEVEYDGRHDAHLDKEGIYMWTT
ncbi:uncharacterized protein MKK02DRAFT_40437 [Dioszegia hungarica]|uniref:Uncharacterized protein n=1 Tax=Dioszegia hungarica TaxID=4972 RepID=A0AA38H2M2_9TREE|nr:uncharacterized protein MKK02DRAFT_40437 [Dioszegia hungarica]KAI9633053.1 hypothetical protein MKK02DRAFT_40437 [Dioszegia hungarica]